MRYALSGNLRGFLHYASHDARFVRYTRDNGADASGNRAEMSPRQLGGIGLGFIVLCFVLPALLAASAASNGSALLWWLAVLVQAPGLLAERWFFFAQAQHPQNLYYQAVS